MVYLGVARIVKRMIIPRDPRDTSAARNRSGSLSNEHVVNVPFARTSVISSTFY